MSGRRPLLRRLGAPAALVAALAGLPPLLPPSRADAGDERPAARSVYEGRRRSAVRAGCRWLARKQNADGGFGDDKGVVAITALSILALMAESSGDGRGPYGAEVRRGVDFLLRLVEMPRPGRPKAEDGYFKYPNDADSRMHGQGYATLALATALGTSDGERATRIRKVLQQAVACIEQAQTETGGFGYDPVPNKEHEGSVTVTVAQGLRAARDAGLAVDERVVRNGLHYLKQSQRNERGSPWDGSFRYSLHQDRTSYALTAAALSSFFLYGTYTDDAERTLERGLRFLMGPKGVHEEMLEREWWYYGNFYAAWACWQKDGDRWDDRPDAYWGRWHRLVYERILEEQKQDGSWEDAKDRHGFGTVLPTAFAILTLAVPDEVLPIFQR